MKVEAEAKLCSFSSPSPSSPYPLWLWLLLCGAGGGIPWWRLHFFTKSSVVPGKSLCLAGLDLFLLNP